MSKRVILFVFGSIIILLGVLMSGCENPFDDDESAQVSGSSTIVGNITAFDASNSTVAGGLGNVVTITVGATGKAGVADAAGNFTIANVPAGAHELYIACNGVTCTYQLTVEENSTITLTDISVSSAGQVIVGRITVLSQAGASRVLVEDNDDEEAGEVVAVPVVVSPVNLSTNIDQSQLSNNTGANLGGASMHQTFTAGVDGDLVSVEIAVSTGVAAEFTVNILATDAGGNPTGGSLGSDTIAVGDMTWSPGLTLFSFNPQVTLQQGVQYAIKLSAVSVNPASIPQWRGNNGDIYAGGQMFLGGVPQAGYDMVFRTYMAVVQ